MKKPDLKYLPVSDETHAAISVLKIITKRKNIDQVIRDLIAKNTQSNEAKK